PPGPGRRWARGGEPASTPRAPRVRDPPRGAAAPSLVDRDRLLGVAALLGRPRQKRERLDRGGIGLEGRLQPRQGAARLTLVQVDASGLASDLRIGVLAGEEPLRHADVVVAAAFLFQLLQGAPKLLLAFVRLPSTEKELAEPSPRQGVFRLEV